MRLFFRISARSVPGYPDALAYARQLVEFNASPKDWTYESLDELLANIRKALSLRAPRASCANMPPRRGFSPFPGIRTAASTRTARLAFDLSQFMQGRPIQSSPVLHASSGPYEAYLRTWGWTGRVPVWYLYFRKIDFPRRPGSSRSMGVGGHLLRRKDAMINRKNGHPSTVKARASWLADAGIPALRGRRCIRLRSRIQCSEALSPAVDSGPSRPISSPRPNANGAAEEEVPATRDSRLEPRLEPQHGAPAEPPPEADGLHGRNPPKMQIRADPDIILSAGILVDGLQYDIPMPWGQESFETLRASYLSSGGKKWLEAVMERSLPYLAYVEEKDRRIQPAERACVSSRHRVRVFAFCRFEKRGNRHLAIHAQFHFRLRAFHLRVDR